MKEIGGYFGLEEVCNTEYHSKLLPLNTGRNALLYLLKARIIKKVYIPFFLCDSIGDVCKRNGYQFSYYKIDAAFLPAIHSPLTDDEYLYVVNYYGQIKNKKIEQLKQQYDHIIIDNSQAFFQKPVNGVDTIYTCRKYFGVPDGAYLSTNIRLQAQLEIDVSKDRMTHLLGRFEGVAADYYLNFINNENILKNEPLKQMSRLTHHILGSIQYENARNKRNENYAYLETELKGLNGLKLSAPDGAFAYPFYMENGADIRKILAHKKIYIPTLWPDVFNKLTMDALEYRYALNILPLPCDQRYGM